MIPAKLIRDMAEAGLLTEHHTASRRGYVSRKSDGLVSRYSGRFGAGWVIESPRWDTTRFTNVTYYVEAAR